MKLRCKEIRKKYENPKLTGNKAQCQVSLPQIRLPQPDQKSPKSRYQSPLALQLPEQTNFRLQVYLVSFKFQHFYTFYNLKAFPKHLIQI